MSGLITLVSGLVTAEAGLVTAEAGLVTAETGLVTAESEFITLDAASILEFEVFEGYPLWFIGLIIFIFLTTMLFILMIYWIFHAEEEVKKKVRHAPSSHEVVAELQKELLKSMEATSRQNWLMIWLTILFITVSVLGGAVILNFFQTIRNFGAMWIAQLIEYMKSILMK